MSRFPLNTLEEVRLFPLPNVVLYPGCVLPLHIFESRYREMLEDALQGDQLLAIATLLPGYEIDYYSRPPIAAHACVGQVVMHEKTSEGTYNLILIGARRAQIQHEISPVRSYRRAAVRIIDENSKVETSAQMWRLSEQLADYLASADRTAEPILAMVRQRKITLSSLTDIMAFRLSLDLDLKLKLLGEPDPVERANRLVQALDGNDDEILTRRTLTSTDPRLSRRLPPYFGDN